MPLMGLLDSGSRAGMTEPLADFHRGLGEIGFTEEQNVAVEYRWASGHYDQIPDLALELVRPVTIIVAICAEIVFRSTTRLEGALCRLLMF
jgi:putative ABC transport system substrate-binding protein